MLRKAAKVVLLLLVLVLIAGYFGIHRLRNGPEIRSETLTAAGLEAPVEILYDSMGVPHIFASSIDDLFLAQGYVHAQHRLWQMEMFRRVLQGRLSEIFGEATLESDRFLRTIGMEEAAEGGTPARESPMYQHMDRYAQGVNAALENWHGSLPPEFVLLRFRPEPWTPVLTQGIEKIMAWDLSNYQTGLNLAAAREVLGDSAFAPLMPSYPDWGVTIVDGWPENGVDAAPSAGDRSEEAPAAAPRESGPAQPPSRVLSRTLSRTLPRSSGRPSHQPDLPPAPAAALIAQATLSRDVAGILELGSVIRASNSWVVGGERSASGKPVLANDMHLSLNAPNIWFLVGLHAPGVDVVGMSIPGAPGVVAGHSDAVAWGYTNAMVDDSDFFIEEVNPGDTTQYRTPDGWASFETRDEVINVRGSDAVTEIVRSTRHGPVVTSVEDRAGNQVLAFQWVAHSPAGTFRALLGMAQARNTAEFLEAMRDFEDPHQNVIFADTAGSWGYWMGGRVPVRASGIPPQLPVPGWTGEHDWIGWVPFEDKPHILAPPRGYIATANNAQSHDEAALQVTDGGWFGPYRAQRISELIEAQDLHDANSLLAIQMDPGSAFVDRYLGVAVAAFHSAGLDDLAQRLESWDGKADLESTEATLFHSWWRTLRARYQDYYYRGRAGYFPDEILEKALQGEIDSHQETADGALGDMDRELGRTDSDLEVPSGFLEDAAATAAQFAGLPWGEAHQLTLNHPMSGIPLAGRLFRFGRSGMPRVGGPYSVNVASFGGMRPPFPVVYGPSQRHVVDLADPDGSGGFILPGGQSGYPANSHSFDQLELWQEGRLWLLPTDRSRVEARSVAAVDLVPGGL